MNVALTALWLPIILSAVAVFIVSSLIWAVIQWHNSDWQKLANENAAMDAMRGAEPGHYSVPHAADMKAREEESWKEKYRQGPAAMITVVPHGELAMGKNMVQWFVWCIVISVLVAYIVGTALAAGTPYLKVFQITATTAALAHGAGAAGLNKIWFGYSTSRAAKDAADAIIYGLVTAGIFGWLWPGSPV